MLAALAQGVVLKPLGRPGQHQPTNTTLHTHTATLSKDKDFK